MIRRLAACALAACALAAALAVPVGRVAAQTGAPRDTSDGPSLPREVTARVVELYNASTTRRVVGAFDLAASDSIVGDVAILGGPATIAGRVTGRVLVINADLTFTRPARVGGDVIIVGGVVDGRGQASIGGELRIYRQVLYFRRDGEQLVADEPEAGGTAKWWPWPRRLAPDNGVGIRVTTARTYNRVEGLPIEVGPTLATTVGAVEANVDALLIYRTAGAFDADGATIGHSVRGAVRLGRRRGVELGGRLYDEIAPVERWQLGDAEVGLASLVSRRDYRDYYTRHGGSLFATLYRGATRSVTLSYADERWSNAPTRDPFSIFRNGAAWRANPRMDEGTMHIASAAVHLDTRTDASTPWAGWYVDADVEHGRGTIASFGPVSADVSPILSAEPLPGTRDTRPGRRSYTRGLLDVRRYNRLSTEVQVNLRLVAGGRSGGDPLPLQRRFSVTGPGGLPGFDFRRPTSLGSDRGTCAVLGIQTSGAPAQCERFALAQIEGRGPIHLDLPLDRLLARVPLRTDWVLFADAGRGWLVGEPETDRVYRSAPPLNTYLADVGAGIDFGSGGRSDVVSVGLYVAKSITRPSQSANVLLRVRRRF